MKKLVVFFILIISSIFISFSSSAFSSSYNVTYIDVGVVLQSGLVEKDETGNLYGYTIDYLKEIEKYSYIEFNFIEAQGATVNEQIINSYKMLDNGEIDMLGATVYVESYAEKYLYAENPYGYTSTVLTCLKTSNKFAFNGPTSLNGIRIGYYNGLQGRYEQFVHYASTYGIDYTAIEYNSLAEVRQACVNGEIDATFSTDLAVGDDYKVLTKFNSNGFYFISQKNNTEVMVPFNLAMDALTSIDSNFINNLYSKYFEDNSSFYLSENETEYIKTIPTIRIGIFADLRPLSYYEDGQWKGLLIDCLEQLLSEVGLECEIVPIDNESDLIDKIKKDVIDLVFGLPSYISLEDSIIYRMTRPIYSEYATLVYTESSNKNNSLNSVSISRDIKNKKYNNQSLIMPSSCANLFFRQHRVYSTYNIDFEYFSELDFNVVDFTNRNKLVQILDRYISQLDHQLDANTYYTDFNYTFTEFLIIHWLKICLVGVAFLVVSAIASIFFFRYKFKEMSEKNQISERYNFILNKIRQFIFEYSYLNGSLRYRDNNENQGKSIVIDDYLNSNKLTALKSFIKVKSNLDEKLCLDLGDGEKWYNVTTNCIYDKKGNLITILGALEDVDNLVKNQETLSYQANYDSLSNLLNRRGFIDAISKQFKDKKDGYCLLMDLDNFKKVNDTFGHHVGDELLKKFSELLKTFFSTKITSRFAGDEFIVVSRETISLNDLAELLENFCNKAKTIVFDEYSEVNVAVSIGGYVFKNIDDFDRIYKKADSLLYDAKQNKTQYSILKE